MRAHSNAFLSQVEVVQRDRWVGNPLEIVFINDPTPASMLDEGVKLHLAVHEWNQTYAAGYVRQGHALDAIATQIPGIDKRKNPNIILARRSANGTSELHVMLASLLPDSVLRQVGLERARTNMALMLVGRRQLPENYAATVEQAFAAYIWRKVSPGKRANAAFFSKHSPLRLLSGDARFWMQRIYRIALERRETWFEPTTAEEGWKPLEEIRRSLFENIPTEDRRLYDVRRPLRGGVIWDEEDHEERETVLDDAITGAGVMESIDPVVELLRTHRTHEDFSSRMSWIKEDFERSFYSKRARIKVELIETVDNSPVWAADDCDGYGEVLFRDLMAAFNFKERSLLIALRHGKTPCEIAAAQGLRGHAAISRRLKQLKAKLRTLLN